MSAVISFPKDFKINNQSQVGSDVTIDKARKETSITEENIELINKRVSEAMSQFGTSEKNIKKNLEVLQISFPLHVKSFSSWISMRCMIDFIL